jgi:hypothetical protein
MIILPCRVTLAAKLIWSKILQEQIKQVSEQLAFAPLTAAALMNHFKGKPKGLQEVLDALVSVGMVACDDGVYRVV